MHSSREHFHTYLQSLDADRGGLPRTSATGSPRVLAHYGVTDLDRTPALEEAVFRIFLAQQRAAADVAGRHRPAAALDRRGPAGRRAGRTGARAARTPRAGHPAALPRGRRPRAQRALPLVRPAPGRRRAHQRAGRRRRGGRAPSRPTPTLPDRAARIEALADIPEQIVQFLAERLAHGVPEREPMLEVLVGRHYREHDLHDLRTGERGGRPFVTADYVLDDRPTRLVTTVGTHAELRRPRRPPGRRDRCGAGGPGRGPARRRGPLPALARGPGVRRGDLHRAGRAGGHPALHRRGAPRRHRGLSRRRPAGRLLHLPALGGGRRLRGRPRARRPPDGRPPAEPVAAARLRRHPRRGARGRAALRVRGQAEPPGPPARRAGPGAPARGRA